MRHGNFFLPVSSINLNAKTQTFWNALKSCGEHQPLTPQGMEISPGSLQRHPVLPCRCRGMLSARCCSVPLLGLIEELLGLAA